MSHPLDWPLLGRYALLVALTDLIPVPLLDTWLGNVLRRRLTRHQLEAHGLDPTDAEVQQLGDAVPGGCMGCLLAVVLWPIKKVLKTVFVVFAVKGMADVFSEVVHRALLLEEALEVGWLPGDTEGVRSAMDAALTHIDTRPMEGVLRGTVRSRGEIAAAIVEGVRVARARLQDQPPVQALADAADADKLGPATTRLSRAMIATLKTTGLVPELISWFRVEMGDRPALEAGLGGVVEPEVLEPATDEAPVVPRLEVVLEEAVEVVTQGAGGEE